MKGNRTKYRHKHKKIDLEGSSLECKDSNEEYSTKFLEKNLQDYVINKIIKKSLKKSNSLKTLNLARYSNDDNPFGDCNLSKPFVWKKKIEAHVRKEGSTKSLKQLEDDWPKDNIEEQINQIQRQKELKKIKDAQLEMKKELFKYDEASLQYEDWLKKEEKFELKQSELRSKLHLPNDGTKSIDVLSKNSYNEATMITDLDVDEVEKCEFKKPEYYSEVRTGYIWNKYNQMYYSYDKPPPKSVQGYKFKIRYPNLVNKTKIPTYCLYAEQDGNNNGETCFLYFHAGPPYKDIAFRIVNNEWEYSHKKGFKCTFEHGVLHLDFNFKKIRYRR